MGLIVLVVQVSYGGILGTLLQILLRGFITLSHVTTGQFFDVHKKLVF